MLEPHIEITDIRPSEPGGPNARANIAGKVSGDVSPDDIIVVYVRAYGFWYVQPQPGSVHPLKALNQGEGLGDGD